MIKEIASKRGISMEVTKEVVDDFVELICDKIAQKEKV